MSCPVPGVQTDIKISNQPIKVEENGIFLNSNDHFKILSKLKIPQAELREFKSFSSIQLCLSQYSSVEEAAKIYYKLYEEQFFRNQSLNAQMATAIQGNNKLIQQYHRLKNMERKEDEDMPRRKRRHAEEITRTFPCPAQKCRKSYGTEGSLAQHVKIKHQEMFLSGEFDIYMQRLLAVAKEEIVKEKSETKDCGD